MPIKTIQWVKGYVKLIDQTKLPEKLAYLHCHDVPTLYKAIKRLSVRGAPALGVAAGFGVLLGIQHYKGRSSKAFLKKINEVADYLAQARPTAVNLFYALEAMKKIAQAHEHLPVVEIKAALQKEAFRIFEEDRRLCRAMGALGAKLIKNTTKVLTICNTGALAAVDFGTALGVLFTAKAQGKKFSVYACETRPLLQGARLTAWELLQAKIKTTLICDSMAATLMKQGEVDIILTGADRIAANGDTANKIGTYSLAVLAHYHQVPFYVVAPTTTIDARTKTGAGIVIEQRSKDEVTHFKGVQSAPRAVDVFNPAFDVTPHRLITGIITEKGILRSPYMKTIRKQLIESYETF